MLLRARTDFRFHGDVRHFGDRIRRSTAAHQPAAAFVVGQGLYWFLGRSVSWN
jgi:hypothetical protein